jgi:hypothetical protein
MILSDFILKLKNDLKDDMNKDIKSIILWPGMTEKFIIKKNGNKYIIRPDYKTRILK